MLGARGFVPPFGSNDVAYPLLNPDDTCRGLCSYRSSFIRDARCGHCGEAMPLYETPRLARVACRLAKTVCMLEFWFRWLYCGTRCRGDTCGRRQTPDQLMVSKCCHPQWSSAGMKHGRGLSRRVDWRLHAHATAAELAMPKGSLEASTCAMLGRVGPCCPWQ